MKQRKARKIPTPNLDNLPQNANYCMIVPDADDLFDGEVNMVSTSMS